MAAVAGVKRTRAALSAITPMTLRSLARLQDGLNVCVDHDWRKRRSLDDWALAITMESTELIDSYPWKWWKNVKAQPDLKNVKIELVDILHFSLSGAMLAEDRQVAMAPLPSDVQPDIQTPLVETANAVATFRNVIRLADLQRFDVVTQHVIAAAGDLEFNLVAYYIAKHTLNYIRQLGGYKTGDYKKVREGKEDNELLHDAIVGVSHEDATAEPGFQQTWDGIMVKVYDSFDIPANQRRTTASWLAQAEAQPKATP